MYIIIALFAFRIIPRARLCNTTEEDIQYHHDALAARTKNGAPAVWLGIL